MAHIEYDDTDGLLKDLTSDGTIAVNSNNQVAFELLKARVNQKLGRLAAQEGITRQLLKQRACLLVRKVLDDAYEFLANCIVTDVSLDTLICSCIA